MPAFKYSFDIIAFMQTDPEGALDSAAIFSAAEEEEEKKNQRWLPIKHCGK